MRNPLPATNHFQTHHREYSRHSGRPSSDICYCFLSSSQKKKILFEGKILSRPARKCGKGSVQTTTLRTDNCRSSRPCFNLRLPDPRQTPVNPRFEKRRVCRRIPPQIDRQVSYCCSKHTAAPSVSPSPPPKSAKEYENLGFTPGANSTYIHQRRSYLPPAPFPGTIFARNSLIPMRCPNDYFFLF